MRYISTCSSIIEKQKGISIPLMTDDASLFGDALLQIRKNYCLKRVLCPIMPVKPFLENYFVVCHSHSSIGNDFYYSLLYRNICQSARKNIVHKPGCLHRMSRCFGALFIGRFFPLERLRFASLFQIPRANSQQKGAYKKRQAFWLDALFFTT